MATPARIAGVPYVAGRNAYTDADGAHYGIAIHNTSNNATAEAEASYATRRTDGVSSHLYVDRDSVVQSLPLTAKAGHAGSSNGNNNAIAVEITGVNGKSREWWLANVAWDRLGAALAWVIRNDSDYAGFQVRRASVAEMKANPKVKAFYSHDDMRRAWGGTTHTDPGPNFPWDRLFKAVNDGLAKLSNRPATPAGPTPTIPTTPPAGLRGVAWGARTMRRGCEPGTDVWELQRRLVVRHFPVGISGAFGPQTEGAVQAFQRSKGLDDDGIVGPLTRAAISR
ncbi:N-acetylmuramoyl-L-alanine amidase [Actinoplanes sp. CA-054009]